MPVSMQLVDRHGAPPDLHVLYRDEDVADPRVSNVVLTYRGSDIGADLFDERQPFSIDVGSRIIDLLGTLFEPPRRPTLKVEAVGTTLRIGPGILRKGQSITSVILTDGPCSLTESNPLPGVKVKYRLQRGASGAHGIKLGPVIAWAVVIFIAFYLVTEPTGAANFFNTVGKSLADFFNSL